MAAGATVGYATLQVIPSIKGVSGQLASQLAPVAAASTAAGKKAGTSFSAGIAAAGAKAGVAGKKLTKGVTAPILALGASAIHSADKVADLNDRIKINTGATGKTLAGLQATFEQVAKAVPVGMDTAADAIGNLNTLTGATGPTLKSLATNVLEASRVMGEDGAANAAAFGRVLTQWGVPASKGVGNLKALFLAGQKYGVGLGEQMNLLNAYGPILANAGFSMKESVALFGQMQKAGLSVERLMPGLNMGFRKWAQAGKDPQKMLALTIKRMKGAKSSTKALAIATDAFGAEGAQRLTTAVRQSGVSFKDLSGQLKTSSVDILATGKNTRTMSDQMQLVKTQATYALAKLGKAILPMVTEAIKTLASGIEKLSDWFNGLSDGTKHALKTLAGIAAVVGPALLVFSKLVKVGGRVVKFAKSARKAMLAMNLAMRANPVLAIVSAIVALGAALIYAYKHSETFRKIVNGAFKAVKKVVLGVVNWFRKDFVGFFTKTIPGAFEKMLDWIKSAWDAVVRFIKRWGPVALAVLAPFIGIPLLIWQHFSKIKQYVSDAWNAALDWLKGIGGKITAIFSGAAKWLKDAGTDVIAGLWDGIKDRWKAIGEWFRNLGGWITGVFKRAVNWLKGAGKHILSGLWDGIKTRWQAIAGWFRGIGSWVVGVFRNAINWLGGAGGRIMRGLWDGLKNWWRTVWGWFKQIPSTFKGLFTNAGSWLFNKGKALIGGLFRGLRSAASNAGGFIADIGKAVVNKIIDGINWLIGKAHLHRIHIPIPFAPDVNVPLIPTIPHLARGGMTTGPTLAMVGDNPSGREAVLPLDSSRTRATLAATFADALRQVDGDRNGGVYVAEGAITVSDVNDPVRAARATVRRISKLGKV